MFMGVRLGKGRCVITCLRWTLRHSDSGARSGLTDPNFLTLHTRQYSGTFDNLLNQGLVLGPC
jgi:hypothetical protein